MKDDQQSIRVSRDVWERLRRIADTLGTSNYSTANLLLLDIMARFDDDDRLWAWYRECKATDERGDK